MCFLNLADGHLLGIELPSYVASWKAAPLPAHDFRSVAVSLWSHRHYLCAHVLSGRCLGFRNHFCAMVRDYAETWVFCQQQHALRTQGPRAPGLREPGLQGRRIPVLRRVCQTQAGRLHPTIAVGHLHLRAVQQERGQLPATVGEGREAAARRRRALPRAEQLAEERRAGAAHEVALELHDGVDVRASRASAEDPLAAGQAAVGRRYARDTKPDEPPRHLALAESPHFVWHLPGGCAGP